MAMTSGDKRHRTSGLLRAAPGFIMPAFMLVWCVRWLWLEAGVYDSLPSSERTSGGSLDFLAAADVIVATVGVACMVLLFLPPLLVGLPHRVRVWQAVVALTVQALPLLASLYVAVGGSVEALLALLGFAYVPVLVIVRFVLQARTLRPSDPLGETPS